MKEKEQSGINDSVTYFNHELLMCRAEMKCNRWFVLVILGIVALVATNAFWIVKCFA